MSIIRISTVTKKYENKTVLHNISFRADKSEKLGLVGKNGSGKTTMFKLILGQEAPDEGVIEIDEGLSFGYFLQFSELDDDDCILDILDREFYAVYELESKLKQIEGELSVARTKKN